MCVCVCVCVCGVSFLIRSMSLVSQFNPTKIKDSVEYRQSRVTWQTINEVSRRKSTAKAKLKVAKQ